MFFVNIIRNLLAWRKTRLIKKQVTLKGNNYIFGLGSRVSFMDGSTKENIILGENVWLHGTLSSQSGGKIILDDNTKLGGNCKVLSVELVVIGKYTAIGDNVTICDNNNHPISPEFRRKMRMEPTQDYFKPTSLRLWKFSEHAPIIIGENVWIGQYSRIQKGVTIGDNSIIAANSVVTKDVPANCIAAGNPARIVRTDIDKIPSPIEIK